MRPTTRTAAAFLVAGLALGGVACNDEDGDGATTDEEIGEVGDEIDEGADQLEEEIKE